MSTSTRKGIEPFVPADLALNVWRLKREEKKAPVYFLWVRPQKYLALTNAATQPPRYLADIAHRCFASHDDVAGLRDCTPDTALVVLLICEAG